MHVWNVLHAARWKYRTPKNRHFGTITQLCRAISLQLFDNRKKNLLNIDTSSICPHHMVNFGLLTPEMCWQVWGTPANSRLGSVTARHSSSGLQLNFAALNRGRHLYSAGRPSRWALAYISSWFGFNLFYEHRKFVGLICFGVCLDIILMCHAVYALGLYT